MKEWGAVGLIEHVRDVYLRFRSAKRDVDKLLLSSSRKALVSLRDSHLNTLLLEWNNAGLLYKGWPNCDIERVTQRNIELWNRIAPFLA